jgi:predicted GIY-YIG superfamily endonuclease
MHPRFARNVERLMPLFDKLIAMKPTFMSEIPVLPKLSGVYLFSEGKKHWYVGRSRNIRNRLAQHRGVKADDNQASFAFLLAREEAQFVRGQHTRKALMDIARFKNYLDGAKKRIAVMDFRFVEEDDPVSQALLEMYCAVVLKTRYNSFETH